MDDPALLEAYLSYYWPVSYAQANRVMGLCGIRPSRVLDLGSGPGPMAAAALDRGATELCLVDHSAAALKLAEKQLDQDRRHSPTPHTSLPEATATGLATPQARQTASRSVKFIQARLEAPEAVPEGPFDLVILGHCLNELGSELATRENRVRRRIELLSRAAAVLSPEGLVMVIEPATLTSARDGMALRDQLQEAGWHIIGPCTRQESCPALAAGENHSCHDEAPWAMPESVRRLAAAAGLDRERIKMFWLVLKPPLRAPVGDEAQAGDDAPARDGTPVGDGTYSGSGKPAAGSGPGLAASADAFRVVSEPLLNKAGRVRYLLCGGRGRFPFSAAKNDPLARAAGFFGLQRYDLIQIEAPETREGGGWGFGPATRVVRILPPEAGAGTIRA